MRRSRLVLSLTLALALAAGAAAARAASSEPGPIRWEPWSDAVFERAKREGRFVLLDLEAVWCHWCHVMDETTYRDPQVATLIQSRFIPVKVDQDARPDISNRYEDYGWPATVIFDADGEELVKFQGYIPPRRMTSLLQGVIDDPSPGPSVMLRKDVDLARGGLLTPELRKELAETFVSRYDLKEGGWGFTHKFLDWDSVERCLVQARAGDAECEGMARETLKLQLKLIDPVWGGVWQYSDSGDWDHPHFEKIMAMQAENLRIYAQAYALWRDPSHLQAARDVDRYLQAFLKSPEGAFYTSQDADVVKGEHSAEYYALPDAERRRRGIPRVDTHLYARENAWVVHSLTVLYGATGEEAYLEEALHAARWVLENRSLPGGGFRHDTKDPAGPYLGDTLAAGRAFLALYAATADRSWLARTEEAAGFIAKRFKIEGGVGFVTAAPSGRMDRPRPQREENIVLARFANLLSHYTGKKAHRQLAEEAVRYLAVPEVARRFNTGGVLLVDLEMSTDPLHVTVVGPKDDSTARALLKAALADPALYKRVELWDRREGPLPHMDVEYPKLPRVAAFVCAEGRCSAPAYTPEELLARIRRLGRGGVALAR